MPAKVIKTLLRNGIRPQYKHTITFCRHKGCEELHRRLSCKQHLVRCRHLLVINLQVSMQWMKALLLGGTPPAFWNDHHQSLLHHHHHQVNQSLSAQLPSQLHHDSPQQLQEQLPLQLQAPGTAAPSDHLFSCQPSPLGQQSGNSTVGESLPIAEALPTASLFVPRQDLGLKSLLQDPSMHSSHQQQGMLDPPATASGLLPTDPGMVPHAKDSMYAAQYLSGHIASTHAAARQSAVQLSEQQQQQQQQQQQAPDEQRSGQNQPQGRPQATYNQFPTQAVQSPAGPSQSPDRQHQSPGHMYQYLDQLPGDLVACRRMLQYSFVLEYFWQASPNQARSVAHIHCHSIKLHFLPVRFITGA